jgi:hypothetical protein
MGKNTEEHIHPLHISLKIRALRLNLFPIKIVNNLLRTHINTEIKKIYNLLQLTKDYVRYSIYMHEQNLTRMKKKNSNGIILTPNRKLNMILYENYHILIGESEYELQIKAH